MRRLTLLCCHIIANVVGPIIFTIGFITVVLLIAAHPGGLTFAPDRICIVGGE